MQRFEQIYAEHREAVRAYVRRRAPETAVDDVVSDTFLVCLRKIDRVPPEPLPWLYAVARKTLANERRRRARREEARPLRPTASTRDSRRRVGYCCSTRSTSVSGSTPS
jgi:RNA polymerase sigma factor (sigma-70 family)